MSEPSSPPLQPFSHRTSVAPDPPQPTMSELERMSVAAKLRLASLSYRASVNNSRQGSAAQGERDLSVMGQSIGVTQLNDLVDEALKRENSTDKSESKKRKKKIKKGEA